MNSYKCRQQPQTNIRVCYRVSHGETGKVNNQPFTRERFERAAPAALAAGTSSPSKFFVQGPAGCEQDWICLVTEVLRNFSQAIIAKEEATMANGLEALVNLPRNLARKIGLGKKDRVHSQLFKFQISRRSDAVGQ